jgi:hypothetical protein
LLPPADGPVGAVETVVEQVDADVVTDRFK